MLRQTTTMNGIKLHTIIDEDDDIVQYFQCHICDEWFLVSAPARAGLSDYLIDDTEDYESALEDYNNDLAVLEQDHIEVRGAAEDAKWVFVRAQDNRFVTNVLQNYLAAIFLDNSSMPRGLVRWATI